ncbi:helix-turn-helix domain-containing protein [Metabacillus rhizolycopersici]|uniref:Helix-turn-helix domain-containing protein n=1 Tax=Metabacillus rhizolycopersici TaxID=2875709 RepID=A0ABS7UQ72_9BACI|nr:helix-turn-helix domain-containing protein [Metabacillus rhizolycopersici]MBZ5750379.1 helix-turn-helix domain-containing protein [Metabacillus rhizolycopersici]
MDKLNFDIIQSYQSFSTIAEMDQAVRGFLYKHKSSLSEGTMKVLKFIWSHSVKVIGVSFAKYDTIADGVQISRRTVIRATKQLESLGVIKKIPTARMNGKQGVNLLVIQPFQSIDDMKNNVSPLDVTAPVTPNKTENKQSSLCENKTKPTYVRNSKNSHYLKLEESTQKEKSDLIHDHQLDTSFLPESVHKEFVQAAKPFLNAVEIYKLWKRVLIVYNKMKLERCLADVMDKVIDAFKQTVFMKKMGRIHSTFEGYFYRVMYEFLIVEKRNELRHRLFDFIGD